MAAVFGVTSEQIQQALQEGDFVLPGEDTVGADTTLLQAREILDHDALRQRLEARFDEEVPTAIREGFEVGLERMQSDLDAAGAFNPQDPFVQNAQRRLNEQAVGMCPADRRHHDTNQLRGGADERDEAHGRDGQDVGIHP